MRLAHATSRHTHKRIPHSSFLSLKNYVVESYLGAEALVFQERVGHFPLARGPFQSHIPHGRRASQTIRENLAKQWVIVPIGSHLPTKHVQVHAGISCTIILDKL